MTVHDLRDRCSLLILSHTFFIWSRVKDDPLDDDNYAVCDADCDADDGGDGDGDDDLPGKTTAA